MDWLKLSIGSLYTSKDVFDLGTGVASSLTVISSFFATNGFFRGLDTFRMKILRVADVRGDKISRRVCNDRPLGLRDPCGTS